MKHAKMSDKTRSKRVSSPTRQSTSSCYYNIFYVLPKELLSVIEAMKI
jgi:hypothetical protein